MNFVSNDAQKMEDFVIGIMTAFSTPMEILVSATLMWWFIGWQSLSGVLYFVFLLLYNFTASKTFGTLRAKAAIATDCRLALLNNIICGIRAVKMYTWEWNFRDLVKHLRSQELKFIRYRSLIISSFVASYNTATPTASFISVTTLLFTGVPLTSFSIFTLLVLLNIIRFAMCVGLSSTLGHVVDGKVAIDRVEEFLTRTDSFPENFLKDDGAYFNKGVSPEDIDLAMWKEFRATNGEGFKRVLRVESWKKSKPVLLNTRRLTASSQKELSPQHIEIVNASVSWSGMESRCVLQGVTLNASAEELVIVTGPVGSGKSSLLMAILGEIPLLTGQIAGHGKIAYVSQIPWVFSGTVRDNILFGRSLDDELYKKVIDVCDLQTDLDRFPSGDLSLLGQKGVSLSGGQRARVSLARAIYSDADIFLLDDPLSAVDAKVGQLIFDKCICGMLKNKLKILVTHQLQHLRNADQIVLLRDGQLEYKGSYQQLKNTAIPTEHYEISHDAAADSSGKRQRETGDHVESTMGTNEQSSQDMADDSEDNITGTVSCKVYWEFFRAGSPVIALVLLALFLLVGQVSLVAPNYWLSKLASKPNEEQKSTFVIGVFAGLVGVALVLSVSRVFLFLLAILRSSETLHHQMTTAVIKSPVLFVDRNPVGRIMNRFSKDIGCLDDVLPFQSSWAVVICLNFTTVMALTSVVNIRFVLAVVPMLIVFGLVCWLSLKAGRELKRLESMSCSHVYAHIDDTINGLEVVRSSNMETQFIEQFTRYQDEYTKSFFLVTSSKSWLALHLDSLCVIFITCVAIGALLVTQDAALTGLLITYAIELVDESWYGMLMLSEVESKMTSAERVMAYTKLPPEPAYSRTSLPPPDWPANGAISIRGMSFEYVEGGSRVLEDINVEVMAKQKVGIAGRTGAGKSSLVAALFRMPDPQGQVLIDGVDLGTIDIQAARGAMAVITQDPILFAASLRENLDPIHKFSDKAIWTALEEVQLKDTIENLQGGLNLPLAESGRSLSVGERQLLCLARALLQGCKILIMDEATANVDFMTDRLIQQVIRVKFSNCTVLTIAHRLDTIMDYDKVLVIDQGHVVDYDTPRALVAKETGVFASLVGCHNSSRL